MDRRHQTREEWLSKRELHPLLCRHQILKDLDEDGVERPEEENTSANPPSGIVDDTPENGIPTPKVTGTEDRSDEDEDDVHATAWQLCTAPRLSPPPSLTPAARSGHPSANDSGSACAFPYGSAAFPPLTGSAPSWLGLVDATKSGTTHDARREKDFDGDGDRDSEVVICTERGNAPERGGSITQPRTNGFQQRSGTESENMQKEAVSVAEQVEEKND
ncbi:Pre-mRNA 3'-end-processing factor FIP1 [Fukomys damarensis]|uniref:Pre-mRNA 3'-end-processing factor FIP1 n=1 Tax=Fukomys damarensis TaxID=885580 RepID=A0A091DYH4_FUKDA|nr:Pre-mRNA 3'-end-processing factor FIP1 [Fukomys damarensis]